jgi:hypothetical protein
MPMMWELFNEPFDIRPDGIVHASDRSGLGFTLRADARERFKYVDGPEDKFRGIYVDGPRRCRMSVWQGASHIRTRGGTGIIAPAPDLFGTWETNLPAWSLSEKHRANSREYVQPIPSA